MPTAAGMAIVGTLLYASALEIAIGQRIDPNQDLLKVEIASLLAIAATRAPVSQPISTTSPRGTLPGGSWRRPLSFATATSDPRPRRQGPPRPGFAASGSMVVLDRARGPEWSGGPFALKQHPLATVAPAVARE